MSSWEVVSNNGSNHNGFYNEFIDFGTISTADHIDPKYPLRIYRHRSNGKIVPILGKNAQLKGTIFDGDSFKFHIFEPKHDTT